MKSEPKHRDECIRKMNVAIKDWENIWRSVLPQTNADMDNTENIPPEGFLLDHDKNPILLRLPSEFCDDEEVNSDLIELRMMELKLRLGEAFDALKSLRRFLGLKSFLTRQKYNPSAQKGQKHVSRSETHASRAQQQIDRYKMSYRRNWARLQDLTASCPLLDVPKDFKRLQILKDTDCRTLAEWTEMDRQRKNAGERRTAQNDEKDDTSGQLPWIWRLEFEGYDPDLDCHPEIEQWNREGW